MKPFRFILAVIIYLAAAQKLKKKRGGKLHADEHLNLSARILQRDFPKLAKNIRSKLKKRQTYNRKNKSLPSLTANEIYAAHLIRKKPKPNSTRVTGYEAYPWLDELLK